VAEVKHPALRVIDPYTPFEIAILIENVGVRKARLAILLSLMLGIRVCAFIAFGAMFYTVTITGIEGGFGVIRLLGALIFSLGFVLVIVGGAELFTGICLIVMAWADKKVWAVELLRNWAIVHIGKFIGSVVSVVLVYFSGTLSLGDSAVQSTAISISKGTALPFIDAFVRGMLRIVHVCLAVWKSFDAHHVAGKFIAIVLLVTAFVALDFEHSGANKYSIPVAMHAGSESVYVVRFIANLQPVTLGNIVGGSVLAAAVIFMICQRHPTKKDVA